MTLKDQPATPHSGAKNVGPKISGRAAAVFGVSLSFFVMAASGLMLAISPKGRTALEIDWIFAGLSRDGWEAVHLATSILFIAFALWHLIIHIAVYKTLLLGRSDHTHAHSREAMAVLLVTVIFVVTAIMNWPPASWLTELNEYFKQEFWLPVGTEYVPDSHG